MSYCLTHWFGQVMWRGLVCQGRIDPGEWVDCDWCNISYWMPVVSTGTSETEYNQIIQLFWGHNGGNSVHITFACSYEVKIPHTKERAQLLQDYGR